MTPGDKTVRATAAKLGLTRHNDQLTFRLFAPNLDKVNLILFHEFR